MLLLQSLERAGGGATVREDGRLIRAATHNHRGAVTALPIPLGGEATDWLRLIVMGLVGGEHGMLIITESGRTVLRSNIYLTENEA